MADPLLKKVPCPALGQHPCVALPKGLPRETYLHDGILAGEFSESKGFSISGILVVKGLRKRLY
jgi:hypothetical protein